jgi:hypothetical protein
MKRKILVWIMVVGIVFFYSCNNSGGTNENTSVSDENKIVQKDDGTISLKVEKAECYHDMENPATNTAEWNVVVSKTGRYDVWLSSATKDTTDLEYNHSVMLSVLDNRIEALPEVDRVIQNSNDVALPYFRADSFMGSLFIQDTGLYNIQIISEKIVPESKPNQNSKLISVFFTPVTN